MAEEIEEDTDRLADELLRIAEAQLEAGHYGAAVVIAQTVVEARVDLAFLVLLGLNVPRSMPVLMQVLPDRSFMTRGTRALWTELTGDDIKEPRDEWREYHAHVERRNRAAHGAVIIALLHHDEGPTKQGTEASLKAVRAILAHIDRVLQREVESLTEGTVDQFRALRVNAPRPATPPPA